MSLVPMANPGPPFSESTAIKVESSHTYSASFPSTWCIGTVPHGGFVASCFMKAANTHFSTTHAKQNQPHTIALHLTFLRRTEVGLGLFTVTDVKLGRQTSTIHMELSQDIGGSGRRVEVVGYITQSNIAAEDGVSFRTDWSLLPPPPPGTPSTFRVSDNGELIDPNNRWQESGPMPFSEFRKASRQVRFLFPAGGQPIRACSDMWMAHRSGEMFHNESLGLVCDMFPQLIETLIGQEPGQKSPDGKPTDNVAKFWFPTVLLNLEVKKALPEKGLPWLFTRCRAKMIRNGRYDLEITIMDEDGDLVAVSNHVVLAVDAKRNLKERSGRDKGNEKGTSSKL